MEVKKVNWEKVRRQRERREKMKRRRIKLRNLRRLLFYEYVDKGNNGILGPGYRNFGYYRLSWGKLSFMLLLILGLIVLL